MRLVDVVVKHPWLAAVAVVGGVWTVAAVVALSGVVPIKASSGHWTITARFLDFAKVRSVVMHSWRIEAPRLDDEAMVLRGAAHYENGCFVCHGGPGAGVPPVMAAMTPSPPELAPRLARWTPAQLFSIVKHGIKFTGMPAWPVHQRDDEVWAIVAFLRGMPQLDAAGYRRLAYGEAGVGQNTRPDLPAIAGEQPPRAVADVCWRCHGVSGTGRGAFPSLAGQRSAYLYSSLRAFRDRTRFSGIMTEIAARLSDDTMRQAAEYYERLPVRSVASVGHAASANARGATIATRGIPERDIPACAECHGPTTLPKNPAYPKLAAQDARYLQLQLALLKERRRGGSPNVELMQVFVDRLREEDIRDVTQYYAALSGNGQ